jgi:uncharacterized protein involved in outer membrane biogenesis
MRWKWIALVGAALIVALAASAYLFLSTYDYTKLKPRIARMVTEATGRELTLGGEVGLDIGFSPALVVTDAALANPAWASEPQMITAHRIEAKVRLLPLLFGDVEVTYLKLAGVDVALETGAAGQRSWEFTASAGSVARTGTHGVWHIAVDDVRVQNLKLTYRDEKAGHTTRFNLAGLEVARQEDPDFLTLKLQADYNGQPVQLSGRVGRLQYIVSDERFPVDLAGRFSGATVKIEGSIGQVRAVGGIDLNVRVSGKNLEELGHGISSGLPQTDTFDIGGHLAGSGQSLTLEGVSGNVSAGGAELAVSGQIGNLIALSGLNLQLKGSGSDLAQVGAIIGQKLPPTDEFTVQGRLTGSAKALSLRGVQGRARRGSLSLTANGGIGNLLAFQRVDLRLKGSGKDLAEAQTIIGQKLPPTDEFALEGRLTGSAKALSLQDIRGQAHRGSLSLDIAGAVRDVLELEDMDLRLKTSGKELAEIGPLIGTKLPELGAFDLSGHLSGSARSFSLGDLTAVVDRSDLKGDARVEFRKRPKIKLVLESSLLDLTALLKNLGTEEKEPSREPGGLQHRLFRNDPLPFDVLKQVDADISLNARDVRARDADFEFGRLIATLADGDLNIDTLQATYKQTRVSGDFHLYSQSPPRVVAKFLVQDFDLGGLLRELRVSEQVRSHLDIAVDVSSTGDSVHALMAGLDGSVSAVMGKGFLTRYLDLLSVDLSKKVIPFWGSHQKAGKIKCAVVQFDIKNGIATSQAFVFDTRIGVLTGEGDINLATEQVNFLLAPEPRYPSLMSLSTKLRVTGPITDPEVRPDMLSLLSKGARALSALVVGPIGLLAPFVNLGAYKPHPCKVESIGK